MKRIWTQQTFLKDEFNEFTEDVITRHKKRCINSIAGQIDKANILEFEIKNTDPNEEGQEQIIMQTDLVVMTVEEARFLMNHARDVTAQELDMALELQKVAKVELYCAIEDIPREELPTDEFGRSIIDRRDVDI